MDLEAIIKGCKRGDRDAQGALYERYSRPMLALCRRIVNDRDAACDLLHDGFLIVFASIGQLREPAGLEAWMRRIFTNLSLHHLEKQAAAMSLDQLEAEAILEEQESGLPVPPLDVLLDMIERLPDGYREVFKLNVLDGLSHEEIAHMLGIKPKTSSSQLVHARRRLQQMVNDWRSSIALLLLLIAIALPFLFRNRTPQTVLPANPIAQAEPTHSIADPIVQAGTTHTITDPIVDGNQAPTNHKDIASMVGTGPVPARETANNAQTIVEGHLMQDLKGATASLRSEEVIGAKEWKTLNAEAANNVRAGLIPAREATLRTAIKPSQTKKPRPRKKFSSKFIPSFTATAGSLIASSFVANTLVFSKGATDFVPSSSQTSNGIDIDKPDGSLSRQFDTWEGMSRAFQGGYRYQNSDVTTATLRQIAEANSGEIGTTYQYSRPLSIGVRVSYDLTDHLSLQTGIDYTRLRSASLIGQPDNCLRYDYTTRYVGIPLGLGFDIHQWNRLTLYASAGGEVHFPVNQQEEFHYIVNGSPAPGLAPPTAGSISHPVRYSLQGGIGVGFDISEHLQLYAQPELRYHFHRPEDYPHPWNHRPVQWGLPIGLRFRY